MPAVLAVIGIVIFAAGAVVGGLLLMSWGSHQKERRFSVTRQTSGLATQGARQVTGL
jgi:hypothetical protein